MSVSKYIDKVAAEIEGIWFNIPGLRGYQTMKDGVPVIHDGSVKRPNNFPKRILEAKAKDEKNRNTRYSFDDNSILLKGEVVSNPYENKDALAEWMLKYWPDITNNSCGLHFHASVLKNGYYSCLMQPEFNEYYKASLEAFIKDAGLNKIIQDRFFNRSQWSKEYCEANFRPEKQCYVDRKIYRNQSTARYTQLNFCWSLHSTLEVRVFTAHCSPKIAVKCLMWFTSLIDSYLESHYDNFIKNGGVEYDVQIEQNEEIKSNAQNNEDVSDIQDLIDSKILSFSDESEADSTFDEESFELSH